VTVCLNPKMLQTRLQTPPKRTYEATRARVGGASAYATRRQRHPMHDGSEYEATDLGRAFVRVAIHHDNLDIST
jgi:hypothetical protein